ncbi:MAG: ATP-dependent DNA helicase RecG [bacterium]|nr:ATP-dependent DNA helicase RecG [bacterium]
MVSLESPVSSLGKVAKGLSKRLSRLGIETCRDLLFYTPFRFEDYTNVIAIGDLKPGMQGSIHGQVQLINNRRSPRSKKTVTEMLIGDESGHVNVVWFNQPYLTKTLLVGDYVRLSGKTNDNYFSLQMVSPTYKKIAPGHESDPESLVPVYPTTEGLTQRQLQFLIHQAFQQCGGDIHEWIPEHILKKNSLMALPHSLEIIHAPVDLEKVTTARRRLSFEELLLVQLSQIYSKQQFASLHALTVPFDKEYVKNCIDSLSFELTEAQKTALWDLIKDMERSQPMNRLLEGDVGSGKTAVAAIAASTVMHAGYQVALLAPTEILARQHFLSWLKSYRVGSTYTVGLWTSGDCRLAVWNETTQEMEVKPIKRPQMLKEVGAGTVKMIIGTHALIQSSVIFAHLGLAVIDEQHRFGVTQRKLLKEKNKGSDMPHLLSMTATPIPRTLALTLYGDLDLSLIDQMPKGRKTIVTKVVPMRYRRWTYNFVREHIAKGEQMFVICPLIDPSDVLGVTSVKEEYDKLRQNIFPDLRLEVMHGKLGPKEKEDIMMRMQKGEIDVLISTSVVEVGVDVPNATLMMIEGAERFGLSQLHQFRGRVGRSDKQSYCFLLASTQEKEEVSRLRALVESNNGFELAEKDLQIRGMGDLYGKRQSGLPPLSHDALSDHFLIKASRDTASEIMSDINKYPEIKKRLIAFQQTVHFE